MFRRRKKTGELGDAPVVDPVPMDDGSASGEDTPAPPAASIKYSPTFRPEIARRMPEVTPASQASGAAGQAPRRIAMPFAGPREPEGKRLTVGKDIKLSGEINSCDILAVEGTVEASLIGAKAIEISSGGVFKGNAEIDTADIAGIYEGDLIVRDRLTLRSSGKIRGTIRYARLEVELGGEMVGQVETLTTPVGALPGLA